MESSSQEGRTLLGFSQSPIFSSRETSKSPGPHRHGNSSHIHTGKTISTYPSFLWGNVGKKRRDSMMILITIAGIIALAPVTLGIITIFGRKEKKTEKNEKAPSIQHPTSPAKQSPTLSVPDTSNPAS